MLRPLLHHLERRLLMSSTVPATIADLPPDAFNTGPSGTLDIYDGDLEITQDGAIIRDLDVRGSIRVKASDVQLLNFKAESIKFYDDAKYGSHRNLLIEDGEVTSPDRETGITGGHMIVRRTEVHHLGSDAFNLHANAVLESNYVHHLGMLPDSHADGVSSTSQDGVPVAGIVIRGNNFDMGSKTSRGRSNARPQYEGFRANGAIFVGLVGGMVVENNWFNGGNYTVNSGLDGSTFVYRNNRFGREFNWGVRRSHGSQQFTSTNWVDNVWADTGKPAPASGTLPIANSSAPLPPTLAASTSTWTPLGPGPALTGDARTLTTAGRVSAVAGHPTNPTIIYAGGAAGGVWKSTNDGASWAPLTDTQATLSIGSIAIAASSPQTIYVGTGDLGNPTAGRGVLKSTDGGTAWSLLGAVEFTGRAIPRIIVSPTDANVLYVVAEGVGVFKSIDGGQTWSNSTAGLPTSATIGDLARQNSGTLVAAGDGLYVSTNDGASWSAAAGSPNGAAVGGGRVTIYGSVGFAVLTAAGTGEPLPALRSTDGGVTWSPLPALPAGTLGNRGAFDFAIAIEPTVATPPHFYLGGDDQLLVSTNSGQTWVDLDTTSLRHGTGRGHREISFTSGFPIIATDNGLWRRDSASSFNWKNLNANLAVAEVSNIGVHPTDPDVLLAGTIANGTASIDRDSPWTIRETGDGGATAFSSTDPDRAYHVSSVASFGSANFFRRSDDGGLHWRSATSGLNAADPMNASPPLAIDAADGDHVVLGTHRVYRTLNGGDAWEAISTPGQGGWTVSAPIDSLEIAPANSNLIYASAGGHVFVTANGGLSWSEQNLPIGTATPIVDFVVDPALATTAVAAVGTQVWKTDNAGASWQNITGTLDRAIHTLAVDPTNPAAIYVGTASGVFRTTTAGAIWTPIGAGLPNAAIADLEISADGQQLSAATRGRGVWQILLSGTGSPPPGGPTTAGPDGFGHIAVATTFENIDLVPGAAGVFTILDSADDATDDINLQTNTFTFYGTIYRGETSLFVSDNGLITTGIGESSPANGLLTGAPFPAMMSPLWDDWHTDLLASGATSDRVIGKFEDTTGDGIADRLIVEWNAVRHDHGAPSAVTFQAILQLNTGTAPGAIMFNYPDLDTGDGNAEGASATVGIKSAGDTHELLISDHSGSGPLVGSGKAIRITAPDLAGPSVSIVPIAPRSGPLASVTLVFDEPISGLQLADLTLTRSGNPTNLLTGSETLATTDNRLTWVLSGLSTITTPLGDYLLTLPAGGSGIVDDSGNPLMTGASDGWVNTLATTIGSFTINPDPVVGGQPLSFHATDVTDADGTVASVTFYRESNNVAGLQVGTDGDQIFAAGEGGPSDWTATASTLGLPAGQHTFYARALDNSAAPSTVNPSVTITLLNQAPTLGGLVINPDPVLSGDAFLLTATGVNDPDNVVLIRYYRESNAVPGLQTTDSEAGDADDFLLSVPQNDRFKRLIDTEKLEHGSYTYYAQATDSQGAVSNVVSAVGTVVNHPPVVESLSVSPEPVAPGNDVTLTANGVDDPDGSVAIVEFFRESNGTPGLQAGAGGDTLVGSDASDAGGGWRNTISTVGLTGGAYTYYARATDAEGTISNIASASNTVVNQPPVIGSLTANPSPAVQGANVTLTAVGVSDADSPISAVHFYRESNATAGLQTGAGGDQLLASDLTGSTYTTTFSTDGLPVGAYMYYAQAVDAGTLTSNVASVATSVVNQPPVIATLTASPDPIVRGSNLTLTADGVSDPDHSIESVTFYRESNGVAGFQPADTLVGLDPNSSGGGWRITFDTDEILAGVYTYYAYATDDQGLNSNIVSASSTVTSLVSTPPSGVFLVNSSDTGSSNTDDLTSLDNSTPGKALVFGINGVHSGATVNLYADGTLIGSAVAGSSGTLNLTTNGTFDLVDGLHSITAQQTDVGKETSGNSPAFPITIDTTPVASVDIADVSPNLRTTEVEQLGITFNAAVTGFTLSDLTLSLDGGSNRLPGSGATLSSADGGITWTLGNLAAITSAAGTFTLTLPTTAVTDPAGNGLVGDTGVTWVVSSFIPVYKPDAGPDGQVTIDVNTNDGNITRNGKSWTTVSGAGYTGGAAMEVGPDTGKRYGSNAPTAAPELDFRVQFAQAGTYYLWLRGSAPTSDDDSVHVGLDGVLPTTSDEIDKFTPALGWSRTTSDLPVATITVATPGLHMVNVWMREDGLLLDKVLLTLNSGFVPSGAGPAVSRRGGLENQAPTIGTFSAAPEPVTQGQLVTLTAGNVVDPEGSVSAVEFYRDANGNSTFESGVDTPLGVDTAAAGGWTLEVPTTFLIAGTYRYFARARDNYDAFGLTVSALSTVIDPPPPVGGTGPFVQESGGNGIVAFEAEDFHERIDRGGKTWQSVSDPSYSGGSAVQALANTGTLIGSNAPTTSPQLGFQINFLQTGIHYVWLRGSAATDKDDSIHVGLDGALPATSDKIDGFGPILGWSNATSDGPVATINVTSTGTHTFNVWMREDGFLLDKLVITTSNTFIPTGTGPATSPRGSLQLRRR